MIDVLTWKWGTAYGANYVNTLQSMLARHLRVPHRLNCITDNPEGIDERVRCLPMYTQYAGVKKANSKAYRSADNDLCQRRLKMFDREMATVIGPRILHVDLDTVITGDITPLVSRTEPLVCAARVKMKVGVMPGFMLYDAGYLHNMWAKFEGDSVRSDMELLDKYIRENNLTPPRLGESDGVHGYIPGISKTHVLPAGARVVMFFGPSKPHKVIDTWVKEHWK